MAYDPLSTVLEIGGKVLDRFIPDPVAAAQAKLEMYKAQQTGELQAMSQEFELAKGQIDVNVQEAKSESIFVSGGRPFAIWVGGFAMAYVSIVEPIARFIATVAFHYTGAFPAIDTSLTMQVLFGLLGLGGLRTLDKKVALDASKK